MEEQTKGRKPRVVLKDAQKDAVCTAYKNGVGTQVEIAGMFKVSERTIQSILKSRGIKRIDIKGKN